LDEIAGKLATVTDNANGLIIQVKDEIGNISGDAQRLLITLNSVTTGERPKIDHIADQLHNRKCERNYQRTARADSRGPCPGCGAN
jgi:hypothetical protein